MARISAKERKLAETLADPVLWGQGYLRNRDGGQRVYWPHQAEDLLCPDRNIIHLDGRDVGKSVCITTGETRCTRGAGATDSGLSSANLAASPAGSTMNTGDSPSSDGTPPGKSRPYPS